MCECESDVNGTDVSMFYAEVEKNHTNGGRGNNLFHCCFRNMYFTLLSKIHAAIHYLHRLSSRGSWACWSLSQVSLSTFHPPPPKKATDYLFSYIKKYIYIRCSMLFTLQMLKGFYGPPVDFWCRFVFPSVGDDDNGHNKGCRSLL